MVKIPVRKGMRVNVMGEGTGTIVDAEQEIIELDKGTKVDGSRLTWKPLDCPVTECEWNHKHICLKGRNCCTEDHPYNKKGKRWCHPSASYLCDIEEHGTIYEKKECDICGLVFKEETSK